MISYIQKNKRLILTLVFLFTFFVFSTHSVFAQSLIEKANQQLNTGASTSGFRQAQDPRVVAAQMIQILLGLLGSIFLIYICMSGFWYITARGRSDRIEKATDTVRRAVVGLVIVMMAYTITSFVSQKVQESARGVRVVTEEEETESGSTWSESFGNGVDSAIDWITFWD